MSHAEMGVMPVSVIVPVLNEAEQLPALLEHVSGLQAEGCEVLLVDGGSGDGSLALMRHSGLKVIESAPGRARQMNAGARASRGEVLLFLHADTRLPAGAVEVVRRALAHGHVWGRFDVCIQGASVMFPLISAMINWRSRFTGIATGDQAMFVRREAFEAVGGFPDQPLMEDVEMSRRLRRVSSPACLRAQVRTSGRRWESRGVWPTIWLMWRLRWLYWRGVAPAKLAKLYS